MDSQIASVEQHMSQLEQRLKNVEMNSSSTATNNTAIEKALHAYQSQVLLKLKAIKSAITAEGGDISKVREERDHALVENDKLRKEIERNNYRINHLIKALELAESKQK